MPNIERSLISRVIDDGNLDGVVEARVTADFFEDDQHRMVWTWVLEHWTRYGRVPSEVALKENFPAWHLAEVPEPVGYYIDALMLRQRYTIAQNALLEATDALRDNDPDAALQAYVAAEREAAEQTSTVSQYDVLTQNGKARLAFYEDLARNPGRLRGYSTGFHAIDRATRGVQPEQFIVLAGAPKSGKSSILLYSAVHMHRTHNVRVMVVSFEMAQQQQWTRFDALRAPVSYNRLMDGQLTAKETRRLRRSIEDALEEQDFILCTDISATTTVSGIRAQLERAKPDILFIDGLYLMEDDRGEPHGSPQAMTNISRDLKRMTQSTKVPIFGTTQALESKMSKKSGVTAFSIGYTSAFGQDADVVLGIERDREHERLSLLKVVLSRSGPLAQANIEVDWDSGTVSEHQIREDDDGDDRDEEKAY